MVVILIPKKFVWHGKKVEGKVREHAVKALQDTTEFVIGEANKTAPIDEGTLRRSAFPSVDEENLIGAVSYDTPYAKRMHEEPGISFSDPAARHKWLERTIQEQQRNIKQYISDEMRKAFRG